MIWLRAPVDVLVGRVAHGTHRPALADDPEGTLRSMEQTREALYEEVADLSIDTSQRFDDALAEILDAVADRGVVVP